MRARALVLDALGTLFGLESFHERLAAIGASPRVWPLPVPPAPRASSLAEAVSRVVA